MILLDYGRARMGFGCRTRTGNANSTSTTEPVLEVLPNYTDFGTVLFKRIPLGKLTYFEDKLRAISGIAKEMGRLLNDRYLAGMWEGNLLRDLLWIVVYGNESVALTIDSHAPT
jgi:hypothetical protein